MLQVQVARSQRITQTTHGRRTRGAPRGNTGHELSTVTLTGAPVTAAHLQGGESEKSDWNHWPTWGNFPLSSTNLALG